MKITDKLGVTYPVFLREPPDHAVFYEIPGTATVGMWPGYREVWVAPSHRRRGIATALYDLIETLYGSRLEPMSKLTIMGESFWNSRIKRLTTTVI